MSSVLQNIRVLELTQAMAGPYCAMMLGDFGADVIKIERPKTGDQARGWGPPFIGSESAYFLSTNRNKRSLTLNLDTPRGLEILRKLIADADIFLINIPQRESLVKRGMDYASLSQLNPRLIYCSITGYGFTGPKAERAGYDIIAQGEAGLMSFTGDPDGGPARYPIPLADITTGIYAFIGVTMALLERAQTGRGQFIDMALFDSQMTWLSHIGSNFLNANEMPKRLGIAHASIVPYQAFRGRDGKYLMVGVGTEAHWKRFCELLHIEHTLGADVRFTNNRSRNENRAQLIPLLQEIFDTRPASEWIELFLQAEIPTGPINDVRETLTDPQTLARHMIVEIQHPVVGIAKSLATPIKMSATEISYRLPPPLLGEHNASILRTLGYTEAEIQAMQGTVL